MGEPPLPPRPGTKKGDTPTQLAPPADPPHKQRAGQLIAGKYELERLIAQGGMGAVWKAIDTQLERPVAIKFMSPAIAHDPQARQRFNREAKAAARLHTPHVVRIFEHGLHDDTPFIVMELLRGRDLHTRLKQERRVPLEEAARIVAQVAKGLRAAHDANIIHRDLKPQNIFLADVDGELVVKILDFGVAKMEDSGSEATKTGILLGSPHYMSPEQARGKSDIDHRSDVWSLAVITFRMITGKMAFSGEGQGDVIIAIATADLPVPSDADPSLPPPIDAFFVQAFKRDREERFTTAIQLATAFAAAVRASSEASLLTPALGHPLHPGGISDEHPMESTQLLPEAHEPPRPPFASHPSFSSTTGPAMPPLMAGGATPHPQPEGTPYPNSQPQPQLLHTPATGPSVAGLGNAIFSAPPVIATPAPQRNLIGIIALATAGLVCVGIFAALSTGPSESAAETATANSPAPPPAAAPEPEPEPEPVVEPEPAPSAEPSATATAKTKSPPVPPPSAPTQPKPKPRKDWDSFGY